MSPEELTEWLRGIAADITATKPDFPNNVVRGCPIPFFGDVLKARVITIGVNPSNMEFTPDRLWLEPLSISDWQERLLNYFNWPGVPAYGWFETWSICLEFLGLSYERNQAAHIDISPRPTTRMLDQATKAAEFRTMVERDVKWFFALLAKLPQVQLLLVAGPIPAANGKKQQLADFIRQQAGAHGAEWVMGAPLPRLVTPGHPDGIPVFICPYEPKVDGRYAMVRQVYRNRELLRQLAAPKTSSVPLLSAQLDWSSAIGNFITNFGMLDLLVQDLLEFLLPQEEFMKVKERPFYDRVELIKQRLGEADCALMNKLEFGQFFHRLNPLRETRNHIAHGILRIGLAPDQKGYILTLSIPRALDDSNSGEARHLEFAELQSKLKTLNELIEEFRQLTAASVIPTDNLNK